LEAPQDMDMVIFGRDVIEKIFSDIFKTEDALVRGQFVSGTHALTVALFRDVKTRRYHD
jgi:cystathionine beta-lyase family protein involved in aluminum resistance